MVISSVELYTFIQGSVPPQTECGGLHDGVIENGRTCNPLTIWTVLVLVLVQVRVYVLGDPQSVQLRNATTTVTYRVQ